MRTDRKRRAERKTASRTLPSERPATDQAHVLRVGAGYLALGLFLARALYPSEDAATGSGLLCVLLAFLPVAAWLAAHVVERSPLRWNRSAADVPLLGLLLWCGLSAGLAAAKGPAVTMALEWLALGALFWSVRVVVLPLVGRRAVLELFVALAGALALYGLYQAFWGLEQLRVEFERNRLQTLRELGIEPGSAAEQTFLNRLNSHEAFATFALANSLAGLLVPATLLVAAWLLRPGRSGGVGIGLTLLLTAGVLVTQSRSAVLALAVAGLALAVRAAQALPRRRLAAYGAALAIVLIVVVAVGRIRGKFDEQLFTGAWQSLRYRLEYWQATMGLILDHPVVGVGPGNFRSHYLRYKLATSSEEITDPHNFAFELAATLGIPGLLLFGATMLAAGVAVLRQSGGELNERSPGYAPFVAVPLVAVAVTWWTSGTNALAVLGITAIWMGLGVVIHRAGLRVDGKAVLVAICALLMHLSFAGGVQFPGVWLALWLPLAVAVPDAWRTLACRGAWVMALLVAWMAAFVMVARGFVLPELLTRALVAEARHDLAVGNWAMASLKLRRAVETAPWDVDAWAALSRLEAQLALTRGFSDAAWPWALRSALAYREADPASPWPCRDAALLWAARARAAGERRYWAEALRWIRRARARYPTDLGLAYLEVQLLAEAGEPHRAQPLAHQLLQQNARCPHPDRRLSDEQVENLKRWASVRKE